MDRAGRGPFGGDAGDGQAAAARARRRRQGAEDRRHRGRDRRLPVLRRVHERHPPGLLHPLLTDIARHLDIHDADINWFEAAQLLLSAMVVPVFAKLGDIHGYRRMLLITTALTAAASWAVAFSPTFWVFLVAWSLQGFYVVWLPLQVALIYARSRGAPTDPR
ncbi:MFS transporter [Oerskovia sp. M15]